MDRIKVLKAMNDLQNTLSHDPDYMDLAGYAPELKYLIKEYQRLIEVEKNFVDEVTAHTIAKQNYINVVKKMKRYNGFLNEINLEVSKEIPNLKNILLLSKCLKPKGRKS
jgi:hypothetical protein